jgi:hypothetical protein
VVDSACSINLTAFRIDFVTFASPSGPSSVGGVGVDVKASSTMRFSIRLASGKAIHRTVHALNTPIFPYRPAQRIGRLLNANSMQSHSGCEFLFPIDSAIGVIMVPKGMGVLEPSGNGLYLLPHQPRLAPGPTLDSSRGDRPRFALTAQCDPILWHRLFGHLNMQSLHAQHTHGVPTNPTLASCVRNLSCDSCLLHKVIVAPATPVLAPNHPAPCSTYPQTFGVM